MQVSYTKFLRRTLIILLFSILYLFQVVMGQSADSSWSNSRIFGDKVFIENKGQYNEYNDEQRVLFGTAGNLKAYFNKSGLSYNITDWYVDKEIQEKFILHEAKVHSGLYGKGSKEDEESLKTKMVIRGNSIIRMNWENSNQNVKIIPVSPQKEYYNYQVDNLSYNACHTFMELLYQDLYQGINVNYTHHFEKGIKYDIEIAPGADPSLIVMNYENVDLELDNNGDLILKTKHGSLMDSAPLCYYKDDKKIIQSKYILEGNKVRFWLDEYDKTRTIVIDPWVQNLNFANIDEGYIIDKDANGNIYVYGSHQELKLKKFSSTGTPIWTYITSYWVAATWHGGMAVLDNGDVLATTSASSSQSLDKVSSAGAHLSYTYAGVVGGESFCVHAEGNNFVIAGGGGAPQISKWYGASIDTIPGSLFRYDWNSGNPFPSEIRSFCKSLNGNYYGLTCEQDLPANTGFPYKPSGIIGVSGTNYSSNSAIFVNLNAGHNLPYYGPGYNYSGNPAQRNGIASSYCHIYTYDGKLLKKWDAFDGSFVNQVSVNNGDTGLCDGLLVDSCSNVYVGTINSINKYDKGLNFILNVPVDSAIYDMIWGENDEIIATGNGLLGSFGGLFPDNNWIPFEIDSSYTNSNCSSCTGSAVVTPSGGNCGSISYSYLWNTGSTDSLILNLCPGNYYCLVTAGCLTDTVFFTINSGNLQLNISSSNSSCMSLGSITANINGGTVPFTFQWNNGDTNQTINNLFIGTYFVTINDNSGCQIIGSYSVTSDSLNSKNDTLSISFCNGDSVLFGSKYLMSPGWYYDSLLNAFGCDSIIVLELLQRSTSFDTIIDTICMGSTYYFSGSPISTTGIYIDTVLGVGQCDSIVVLDLKVIPNIVDTVIETLCAGSTYNLGNQTITTSGIYSDTLFNANACDTIVVLDINFMWSIVDTMMLEICQGDSLFAWGDTLVNPGYYADTVTSYLGCDSITVISLSTDPGTVDSLFIDLCAGSSYIFNNQIITTSGTYIDSIINPNGCDSITILDIIFQQQLRDTSMQSICVGDSMFIWGDTISTPGYYSDTSISYFGCDSISVLSLIYYPSFNDTITHTVCSGDSILLGNTWFNNNGIQIENLYSLNGCDSIITHIIQFNNGTLFIDSVQICNGSSYNFNGQIITQSGFYFDTVQTINGCDSILQLNLIIGNLTLTNYSESICYGSTYNFNGVNLYLPGIYTDTIQIGNGCDSIVILNLSVKSEINTPLAADICEGDFYYFSGQNIYTSGFYEDTLLNSGGCDSILKLKLNVSNRDTTTLYEELCYGQKYYFNNQVLETEGEYISRLYNQKGCDSIVTLLIDFDTNITTSNNFTICQGDSLWINNTWIKTPGTYGTEVLGADSCWEFEITHVQLDTCESIESELFIPNSFTPNGDGLNDQFKVKGIGIEQMNISIFNRWGDLVFESSSLNLEWDGTLKGEQCPLDVYVYSLEYKLWNQRRYVKYGSVILVR